MVVCTMRFGVAQEKRMYTRDMEISAKKQFM